MRFHLPEGSFFRFQDCPAYQKLKGQGVTEMDFVWLDQRQHTPELVLVECKQLTDPSNPSFEPKDIEEDGVALPMLDEFTRNAWHALAMLAQNRSGIQASAVSALSSNPALSSNFDFEVNQIRVVFILNLPANMDPNPLHQALSSRLQDARAVFRLDSVAVLSHAQAKRFYPGWLA